VGGCFGADVHDGNGVNVALTDRGPVFAVFRQGATSDNAGPEDLAGENPAEAPATEVLAFSAQFVGARETVPVGRQRAETVFNYFVGPEERWRSEVPSYEVVAYEGLYEGIDLYTWGQRSRLKYEFHVAPGADYRAIQVRYEGITGLSLAEDGSLIVGLGDGWGHVVDGAPYIYQEINGERLEVSGRYVLVDAFTYAFELTGWYDPSRPLVIDPDLVWSTFLGGRNHDQGYAITVDASGNAYVTGYTGSIDFPTTPGAFDRTYNFENYFYGQYDVFVAKLDPEGAVLVYSTFLGGTSYDYGYAIAVNAIGNAYVMGYTWSSDFPTTPGAFDTTHNGNSDIFVARVSLGDPIQVEDLGTIDFRALPDLTMGTAEERLFRMVPMRDGVLTVEALGVGAGETLIGRVYDKNPLTDPQAVLVGEFSTLGGEARLDSEVEGSREYFLYLRGNSANFDLRIANLVSESGGGAIIFGTAGNDVLQVNAATAVVDINGVVYDVPDPGDIAFLRFEGEAGWDMLIIHDGPANDVIRLYRDEGTWDSGGVLAPSSWRHEEEVYFYATAGGHDRAEFYDHYLDGTGELPVKFKSEPQYNHAKIVVPGTLYHRVKFLEEVVFFATGENDLGVLFGSPGNDRLEAQWGRTRFQGPGFDVELRDVAFIRVDASSGGTDRAWFYDSRLKDEFQGKATKSEMFDQVTNGQRYRITARYFDEVFAKAGEGSTPSLGTDKAALWDTPGDDLVEVVGDMIRLYRWVPSSGARVLTHQVELFETVKLRDSVGGEDRIDEVSPPVNTTLIVGTGWLPL